MQSIYYNAFFVYYDISSAIGRYQSVCCVMWENNPVNNSYPGQLPGIFISGFI